MNNKNHRALFDAVSGIDDDLIAEAAAPKVLPFPKRILRVAAIAAVIAILMTALLWPSEENYITGPGVLTVYAHEVDADGNATIESEILEEGVKFTPKAQYNPTHSYHHPFIMAFSVDENLYPGMDLTLEVKTNAGIFCKLFSDSPLFNVSHAVKMLAANYGQHFTVDTDTALEWRPNGFDYAYMEEQVKQGNHDLETVCKPHLFTRNPSFIDVIIRANDLIVGYCVIEIREVNGITGDWAQDFSFELLTMVSFPQVDGYWQNVKLEYVQEQINKIHTEREALS